ncbi:MAG: hypothetical protein OCD02_20260 [Spirochaetaceae bacterium]
MKRIFILLLLSPYLFSIEDIDVTSKEVLSSQQEELVTRTYETFHNWPEMLVKKSNLIFEDDKLSIIIELDELNYKNIEISQYMPSGIQLYYNTFYEYDFRMFKDGLFMRLRGQYFSKEEFLEELYKAVQDPILYIKVHDPSYFIKQIDLIREENKDRNKELLELIENLTEQHNKLQVDYTELLDKHQKLTTGVISLNNTGFLGSLAEYDTTYVELVITHKTENSNLTVKELAKLLKDSGTPVPEKVIESIFIIYFEEFSQNK